MYGGRCLKLSLDLVHYTTGHGRCDDGGHLYHYKSLVFDKEPVRLLTENKGKHGCHRGILTSADHYVVVIVDQQPYRLLLKSTDRY